MNANTCVYNSVGDGTVHSGKRQSSFERRSCLHLESDVNTSGRFPTEILVNTYQITRFHYPEDYNMITAHTHRTVIGNQDVVGQICPYKSISLAVLILS